MSSTPSWPMSGPASWPSTTPEPVTSVGRGGGSGDDGVVSWRMLREEAQRRLAALDLGDGHDPVADARRLVERASGESGADLVLALDRPVTRREVAFFDQMLERRSTGEPLQYVLGVWGFRTLELMVDHRVLIPRPETEVVVGHALVELDRCLTAPGRGTGRAVDLGTGSGAIGLSLAAERPGVEVWMTDVSSEALDVARANLAGLGRTATRVRLSAGSWFAALPDSLLGSVDVIVSNPPYVAVDDPLPPVVAEWEPSSALFAGADGLDDVRVIVGEAPEWLAPGGALVVELAPTQADAVADLATAAGFGWVRVEHDLAGRPRAVVARR